MSDRLPTLRVAEDAQQYFALQFMLMFDMDCSAIYRLSDKPEVFIRAATFKSGSKIKQKYKFDNQFILPPKFKEDPEQYFYAQEIYGNTAFDIDNKKVINTILLTVKRGEIVEFIFYGVSLNPIITDQHQQSICRIFSNFYLQVHDTIKIRTQINDKQHELSGFISENNETLLQLNEKLLTYNQELQQFAYSASHDLQEPLRTITSYIELFLKSYGEGLNDEGREYLNYASNGAQRMHSLIKDLLTYSKLDYQQEPVTSFEGNEIIRQALDNLHMAVEESNALILYPEMPLIFGNHSQVILLFQNLIDNAIKFKGESEPLVMIDVEDKSDKWEFSISDNGIGIESQFQQKIFGIFNRLHGRDEIGGSGLGLSICKKIVEKHNGKISVTSKPGKGSIFTFSIGK